MPEPDLSLINVATPTLSHHPKTENVFLAMEVSLSTLGFDRGDKKDTYALRGIKEYWLLNLQDNVMELYRDPVGGEYRDVRLLHPADFASPAEFSDLKLRVGDFIS